MCANLLYLERDLVLLGRHNFEYIHLHVMAGKRYLEILIAISN